MILSFFSLHIISWSGRNCYLRKPGSLKSKETPWGHFVCLANNSRLVHSSSFACFSLVKIFICKKNTMSQFHFKIPYGVHVFFSHCSFCSPGSLRRQGCWVKSPGAGWSTLSFTDVCFKSSGSLTLLGVPDWRKTPGSVPFVDMRHFVHRLILCSDAADRIPCYENGVWDVAPYLNS